MSIDFTGVPFQQDAFSAAPFGFWDASQKDLIADILQLIAIETGAKTARERWQESQFRNLADFAAQRSAFWRGRLDKGAPARRDLKKIPILTRADLRVQVESEGCLLRPADNIPWQEHQTSGSSGVPVRFYVAGPNSHYTALRNLAQYFVEGRDFSLNRTQLISSALELPDGIKARSEDSWVGELNRSILSGRSRFINYNRPNLPLLRKELCKERIGYLIANPFLIESLLQVVDVASLRKAGLSMWIPIGASPGADLSRAFAAGGVCVRATYSSEECGLIGNECPSCPGHYHIATSNVLVECLSDETVRIDGQRLGRVIVTKLHSFATPLIRYDIGDLGVLEKKCPCGHDGPTLHHVVGRSKNLLRKRDGSVVPFLVEVSQHPWLADYKEYRLRQTALDEITVEVGGPTTLSPAEEERFRELVSSLAGEDLRVVVIPRDHIDWGSDTKRLAFSSPFV